MPFPPSPPAPVPVDRDPIEGTEEDPIEGGSWARVDEWDPGPLGANYQPQPDGGSWARINPFRPDPAPGGIYRDGAVHLS